jgi:hypothetical protein
MIIGRRLIINWGDHAIAIERLYGTAKSHGVPSKNLKDGGVVSRLQTIHGLPGGDEISFEDLEANTIDNWGRDINHYLSGGGWLTADEQFLMETIKQKKCDNENQEKH